MYDIPSLSIVTSRVNGSQQWTTCCVVGSPGPGVIITQIVQSARKCTAGSRSLDQGRRCRGRKVLQSEVGNAPNLRVHQPQDFENEEELTSPDYR